MSSNDKIQFDDIENFALLGTENTTNHWSHVGSKLTKVGFVKLWQTSTSMDEFMSRIAKINEVNKKNEWMEITEKPHVYLQRANYFREWQNVNLKELEWENMEEQKDEWQIVRELAEKLS